MIIMAEEKEKKTVKKVAKKEEVTKKTAPSKEVKTKASDVETVEKTYSVRGNIFEGKVISAKANKTVTVERVLTQYVSKYERYKKVKSKIKAHNPVSINAKEGDIVRVGETRRISKTKNFLVMEIINEAKK
jgi:small subunit ribosomal protein S17